MPARRDLGAGLSGCAVHRFLFCDLPPGLAFAGAYLVVVAEGTRAGRAVVGSQEEVAGTAQTQAFVPAHTVWRGQQPPPNAQLYGKSRRAYFTRSHA